MFENFLSQETLIYTIFTSIMLIFVLWYLKRFFNNINLDFDMKSGMFSSLPDVSLNSNNKEKGHIKRDFKSDVQLIIKEIVELDSRRQYIDLIEKFKTQLNSANDYMEKQKGLLRKLFLDILDKKLRENGEDTGKVASHNEAVIYEAILDLIHYEVYDIIRDIIHEEEYINADINSLSFTQYIDNKVEGIVNRENNILNRYYVCFDKVSRSDIYKIHRDNEGRIKNILKEMFYDMKQNNDIYIREINNISKKIDGYLEDYFKRGISTTVEE